MRQPHILVVGSLNMDVVIEADRAPRQGETVMGKHVHFIPGGKGANQAVAAARLGARTTMIGAVGTDHFGANLVGSLTRNGVDTHGVKAVSGVSTGIASILLAHGDNQIVVVPGANAHCLPTDILQHAELFAGADVVLLQLEIPLETVCIAAETAKRFGKTVILNPAPAQRLPTALLQNVDYITPNRSELVLLAGLDPEAFELEKAMEWVRGMGPRHVIATLGSEGSAYLQREGKITIVPAYKVPVVDTTGAGDAFNAGLAYALAAGSEIVDAVTFASKVSALAVTKFGAQTGMPTYGEVAAYDWSSLGLSDRPDGDMQGPILSRER